MKSRPLMVHFGAGNIGRSLVGTLFSRAGYDIVFADAAPQIVQALQERHGYRVVIKDEIPPGAPDRMEVGHVDAVGVGNAAAIAEVVARADVIGTSVGAGALTSVLRSMAPGLARRDRPVSIIFCENLHGVVDLAADTLRESLPPGFDLRGKVGLVATSIGKMVPIMPAEVRARDPLEVWGEAYNIIIADRQAFVGPVPEVEGLELKDNFQAYVDRKLYIHNLGHAVCACLGFLLDCTLIAEAMEFNEVAKATRNAMMSSAAALATRYRDEFTIGNLTEYVDDLMRRFRNRALGDTVYRVGRDLPRKLAPDDRFIGTLKMVSEAGGNTRPICLGIAAALHFAAADEQGQRFAADDEVRSKVVQQGVDGFLTIHSKLDPTTFVHDISVIKAFYDALALGETDWDEEEA